MLPFFINLDELNTDELFAFERYLAVLKSKRPCPVTQRMRFFDAWLEVRVHADMRVMAANPNIINP